MVINCWCIGFVKKNEEGSYSGDGRRWIWWCDRGALAAQAIAVVKTIWIDIITIDIVVAAEIIIFKNDLLQQHLFIANKQHRHLLQILHKDIRGTLIIILIIIAYLLHPILFTRNLYILYPLHTHTHLFHTTTRMHLKIPIDPTRKKAASLIIRYPIFFYLLTFCFLPFYHEYNLLQAPACI